MSKESVGFPATILGGITVGVMWTVVAGTIWQWVPIAGALAAVYGVTSVIEREARKAEKKKKGGDNCC